MRGDATLFTRGDEIEALWGIIDPILKAWKEDQSSPIPQYPAGSAGPPEADQLMERDRKWRRL
jgi:glucose-6-phosphate 1-dehydrogenase